MSNSKKQESHFEFGNFAYQFFWHDRNAFSKLVYIAIPFGLALAYCVMLVANSVFGISKPQNGSVMGVLEDLGNSLVLVYVLFFIYFSHGKFQSLMANELAVFQDKAKSPKEKALYRARVVVTILSLLIALTASILFIDIAENQAGNENIYWLNQINGRWKSCYSIIIFVTWYMSANLFLQNSVNLVGVYKVFKSGFVSIDYADEETKYHAAKLYNCFLLSAFFGIYYLIAVFTIYYSDERALTQYRFKFLVSGDSGLCIVAIVVFLCALYFSFIVISRQAFMNSVKESISKSLEAKGQTISTPLIEREYKRVMDKNGKINIDWNNLLVFIISSVLPAIPTVLNFLGIHFK